MKWRSHYQPYGEELLGERQLFGVRSGYTGHRDDPETGLTYMGARYYSPVIGRFMGVDPAGVDEGNIHSFNRYAYANNNPSKSFDVIEGLVVAHTSRNKALDILNCCNQVIGGLNGLIGIDGCKNMGLANVTKINIVKLIAIAKNLNDSVLFYPENTQGILLVDCYEIHGTQGSNNYSIVVQGCELEEKLSECFPDKSKVEMS